MKPSIQKVQNPEQVRADMRKMRELLRMNQDEFSTLIGISRVTLNAYEKGSQVWGQKRLEDAQQKLSTHIMKYQDELDRLSTRIESQTIFGTLLNAA